ncbi:uncharacterized protein DNG_09078 [Cephalotrichum gorgonifer]|uniref:VOC domain-containing protein n=1 Tax=Cephalotrichum gorgonifer TaxID=2041049 RepID=A0AAE8SZ16_9PEZI|nr:uncharacterized protein DNG_09078 [Cephalotrichum gorgonifer]
MLAKTLLAFGLLPAVMACGSMKPRNANAPDEYPFTEPGSDEPSDPATKGYFMNHISLNVNNLTRSRNFYSDVFGFRHMFTYNLTPHLSFTYMGHSQGGRNGTGYQTTEELIRFKNNNAGLIEMVHFSVEGEDIPGTDKRTSTLSHLGIVVPSIDSALERLESWGATIYKRPGEDLPTEGYMSDPASLGDATNLSDEEFMQIRAGMKQLNLLNIFAADPDGNLLEILPQDEGDLFG